LIDFLLIFFRNSLQSVAPGIFASLPELQNLQLSGNKINSFDVRAFSGLNNQLQKLRHLDVSGNGLVGIVTGSFDELPQLSSLMLGWNDVDVHQIFRDGGKELTYLGIQDYNRSCLKPELFEQLPKLRWVLPDVYNMILTSPDLPLPSDEKRLSTLVKVCITGWDIPDHEAYPGLRDFVSVTIHDTDEGTGVQYPIVAAFFPLHYCPEDDYVNQLKNILCTKPEAPMQI
jgi:Leucine rich repeat